MQWLVHLSIGFNHTHRAGYSSGGKKWHATCMRRATATLTHHGEVQYSTLNRASGVVWLRQLERVGWWEGQCEKTTWWRTKTTFNTPWVTIDWTQTHHRTHASHSLTAQRPTATLLCIVGNTVLILLEGSLWLKVLYSVIISEIVTK